MEEKYYHTKETVEEYIRLAEGYNGLALIEKLKLHLSPNSTILEIGSGPGSDWKILSESFKTIGSDNSEEFVNYLSKMNQNGTFLLLDAVTLETDEQFDAIYSNKVLHHLTDEDLIKSIQRQTKLLNPNGIICHSFWKGEGSEIFKGLFVNYHLEEELRNVFDAHFNILLLDLYEEFEGEDSILLIGQKK